MPAFGIDVSAYNGDISYESIKDQIEFVIIRCGYGNDDVSQDDSKYAQNISAVEALGIPYGIYFYSYALDLDDAESEARHCLRLLKIAKPQYGVWLDMEDGDGYKMQQGFPSKQMIVSICDHFLTKIENAGYKAGLYASASWFKGYLNDEKLKRFDRWVAWWGHQPDFSEPYAIWQFTDHKYLQGYPKPFDGNYAYKVYPDEKSEPHSGASQENMTVLGNDVAFYEDAYTGSKILARLCCNASVEWLWDDGWGWSKCRNGSCEGYIENKNLSGWKKLSDYKKIRILGSDVNVRKEGNLKALILGRLQWGDELGLISIDPDNWMCIEYCEGTAYIKYDSAYIKIL